MADSPDRDSISPQETVPTEGEPREPERAPEGAPAPAAAASAEPPLERGLSRENLDAALGDAATTPGGAPGGPAAPPPGTQPGAATAALPPPPVGAGPVPPPGAYPAGGAGAQAPPPGPSPFSAAGYPPAGGRYAPPGVPPRPPRASRVWLPWVGGGCLGCLPWILLFFVMAGGFTRNMPGALPAGDRIGLIYVEGPIMGGRGAASFLGVTGGSDQIVRQVERARRDRSIKAVVLRINSPGGSAAASQEIYEEVMKLRRARKPVIASMGDVAASGGYYVASAADKIMANGSTMTGSIGVIMEFMNLQGLYGKVGLRSETIKSGKFKDIGSSDRPMTSEERQLLQAMIDDVYDQFVSAVVAGRKGISREQVRRIADGRIFTGRQAMKVKLVDELGNLQDAIALAAKSAGIVGRPTVVEVGRRSLLDRMTGEPEFDGRMRLPSSRGEDERMVRALRQLMQQQALSW